MKKIKQIITLIAVAVFMLSSYSGNAQVITINYKAKALDWCKSSGKGCDVSITIDLGQSEKSSTNMIVPKGAVLALLKTDKWEKSENVMPEDLVFGKNKTRRSYSIRIPAQKMVYSDKLNGFWAYVFKE